MKRNQKSFFIFIGLALSLSFVSSCSDSYHKESEKANVEMQKKAKETVAIQEIGALMQNIERENTRSGNANYPDYFGGIYLDDKFDIVMIVIGQNPENFRKMAEEKVKQVKIHLKKGEYSMNQLIKTKDRLDNLMKNLSSVSIRNNFISVVLDEKRNRINITLKDISPAKIDEFKKALFDSPQFIFDKGEGEVIDTAGINPGSAIRPAGRTSGGSVGYRAKNNINQVGIVSSGHVFTVKGSGAYVNIVQVGIVENTKLLGNVDAAFL